jgi:Uncharacterized conserved protein
MPTVSLTSQLKDEYQHLFDTCVIRQAKAKQVEAILSKIEPNRNRYSAVGDPLGIPWYFLGVIHNMEASLNFKTHLHNGDPLTKRTTHVPPGRPKTGEPPFTWEDSATDALKLERLHGLDDWSLPAMLFRLEKFNGFGYRTRHPEVLSPYLWSFSNHYTRGKFVADGKFSSTAVSLQCGAAILLRRMAETGTIKFSIDGMPLPTSVGDTGAVDSLTEFEPLVRFSTTKKSPLAEELQRGLNNFPGIFVKVDGVPGPKTSEAFKKVTGHFLVGDPRA